MPSRPIEKAKPLGKKAFGKYQLLKRIALGGMAEVYLAQLEGAAGFTKLVVIKQVLPTLTTDRDFVGLFLDEGRLAAFLSHPNIAQTFDLGSVDGRYYLAMEYVPGETLRDICLRTSSRKREVPIGCAIRVSTQVLEALQYAHTLIDENGNSLGIIHRDVTPSNVIVTYHGVVKLLDFGIARNALRMHHTTVGYVRGKYGYMAPEQCFAGEIDHRVDIFAVGTLLYLMVTGQEPYPQESEEELFVAMTESRYPPPSQVKPELPAELEKIILKAMAPSPGDRFSSAREMLEALGRFAASSRMFPTPGELGDFVKALFPERVSVQMRPDRARDPRAMTQILETAGPVEESVPWERLPCESAFAEPFTDPAFTERFTDPAGPAALPGEAKTQVVTDPNVVVALKKRTFGETVILPSAKRWKKIAPIAGALGVFALSFAVPFAFRAHAPREPAERTAPETEEDPKVAQPATGRVRIDVYPSATVKEGPRVLGVTPLTLQMPAGEHRLILENDRLKVRRSVAVTVTAGKETAVVEQIVPASERP
jgi:eukaryotic-like serine/threonine-protein kinase